MVWREMPRRPVRRGGRTTFPSPTVRVSSWPRFANTCPRPRRRGDRMKRREFALLGGSVMLSPLIALLCVDTEVWGQEPGRIYRLGLLALTTRSVETTREA